MSSSQDSSECCIVRWSSSYYILQRVLRAVTKNGQCIRHSRTTSIQTTPLPNTLLMHASKIVLFFHSTIKIYDVCYCQLYSVNFDVTCWLKSLLLLIDCCLSTSQIKESKIDFLPQENALCFDPEEDQTGMKLVLIQHRLDTIEQLFKTIKGKIINVSCEH